MKIEYYNKFKEAQTKGLKKQSKENIRLFIDSFSNFEEMENWTNQFLESKDWEHKIRHELYENIIFPVLYVGYENTNPNSLYFLAQTIQNIYSLEKLHSKIEFKSDIQLLQSSYDINPQNKQVRLALLNCKARGLQYAVHEWPSGILYAPNETPDDFIKDLEYTKELDKENNHTDFFTDVEKIINEDILNTKL